jgi:[CysO sulfur-carrier protein]-S-L-cysteine hydrolase
LTSSPTSSTLASVSVTREALAALEADVCARYLRNEEACGLLVGPADDAFCDEVIPLPNLANRMRELDPARYRRDARTSFLFREQELDDRYREGLERGRPVKVLYHSHLDSAANFSPMDAALLSRGSFGGRRPSLGAGPKYPLTFLVSSVFGTSGAPIVREHCAYVWTGRGFGPASLELGPCDLGHPGDGDNGPILAKLDKDADPKVADAAARPPRTP